MTGLADVVRDLADRVEEETADTDPYPYEDEWLRVKERSSGDLVIQHTGAVEAYTEVLVTSDNHLHGVIREAIEDE